MAEQLRLDIDVLGELGPIWDRVLERAAAQLGPEAVETWLADATPIALQGAHLVLGVPNSTARTWIEKRYRSVLAEALTEIQGDPHTLEVAVIKGGGRRAARPAATPAPAPAAAPVSPPKPPMPALFAPIPLNEKYTFENFVVGQS
ncbi:MAG: hypothetical protein FJ315_06505, partial [SAR202 cluster bacterium]|nr:hypothetical protein [SAR202 cluster bacterium]